ncbi:uncharacterized protein [Centruroides vittatus]
MYYTSLFSTLRPYETAVVTPGCRSERGENPLDLSNKNVRQTPDPTTGSDTEAEILMLEHRKLAAGLVSQALPGMTRHLPPSSVSSFFDPSLFRLPAFRTDASGLCGHSTPTLVPQIGTTPNPFCLDRTPVSTVASPTYGNHALMNSFLQQQQRERCLDQTSVCSAPRNPSQPISFFDPVSLPLHLRANGQRERALFTPTLAAPLGLPAYPLYPDLLSEVGRPEKGAFTSLRTPNAADKPLYLNGSLEAARFAEHLQRLREQHVQQAKCPTNCCATVPCGCCVQGPSQSALCTARGGVNCLTKDPTGGKLCAGTCDLLTPGLSLLGARPNPADLRFAAVNPYCPTLGEGLQRDDSVPGLFQPSPLWGAIPTVPFPKSLVPLATTTPFTVPKKKDVAQIKESAKKESSQKQEKEPEKEKERTTPCEKRDDRKSHPASSNHRHDHDVIIIEENSSRTTPVIKDGSKGNRHKSHHADEAPASKMPRLEAVVSESSVSVSLPKSTTPLSPPPLIAVSSSASVTSHVPTPTALITQPQFHPSSNDIVHNVYTAQHLVNEMGFSTSNNPTKLMEHVPCIVPTPHYFADKISSERKDIAFEPKIRPFDIAQVVQQSHRNEDSQKDVNRTVLQNLLTEQNKQAEYRLPFSNELPQDLKNSDNACVNVKEANQDNGQVLQRTLQDDQAEYLHRNASVVVKIAKSLRNKSRRILGLKDYRRTSLYKLLSRKYKQFLYDEIVRGDKKLSKGRLRKRLLTRIYRPSEGDSQEGKSEIEERSMPHAESVWKEKRLLGMYNCQVIKRRRLKSGLDMMIKRKRRPRPSIRMPPIPSWENENSSKVLSDTTSGVPPEMKRLMVNKALGETILHRAARLGYTDVVAYCLDTNYCDVNIRDNAGYTPLHECCARGNLEIARALLQYGADVNASAAGGIRPLHDAIEGGNVEVVRLVLSYGADPTIVTYSGLTPLKLARSPIMAEFLQGFLADVTGENNGRPLLPWRFPGSASCLDSADIGYDIFDGVPTDAEGDADGDIDFLFEVSEAPHLPAYRLQLPATANKPACNWLRLSDVLNRIGMEREEFVNHHAHIDIISVPRHHFELNAVCSQLLTSRRHPVTTELEENVEVVKLDNNIREILGIETIILR